MTPSGPSGFDSSRCVGGRFIEVYDAATGEGLEIGRILVWEPGRRLVYTWREAGWVPEERREVEVLFEAVAPGQTRVTVTHSGWEDGPGSGAQSEVARRIRIRAGGSVGVVPRSGRLYTVEIVAMTGA